MRRRPAAVVLDRQFQARDQIEKIIAEQFDMRFSFTTFGVKQDLVTGFDLSHETAENSLRAEVPAGPRASLYHPNANQNYSSVIASTGAENESTPDNAGLFLFDTLKFWDDKIQLSGGARWDYYGAELDQRAITWSGQHFRPRGQDLELPRGAGLQEQLSVTAAVFRTDKTNARTPGLTPADPPMVLEGEQRVQGFEIGVQGNITEHWKVFSCRRRCRSGFSRRCSTVHVDNAIRQIRASRMKHLSLRKLLFAAKETLAFPNL